MFQPAADRNLLFGVLALQMDFITREQLIAAMQAWAFDKSKPLGSILTSQKALADDNRQLLEALVQKHLAMHDNNAEKSLAAISSVGSVKNELEKIADADVQASLVHVSAAPKDPYATVAPLPGTLTAVGLRFRILRPHARGGLGEVFVARDEELHREVALKEIQEKQADNRDSRARFLLEAEITGGLEHPGIVPVYGLGTYADGRPYYAMRFIRGDSLKDALERFHKADAAGMNPGQRTLALRGMLGRFVDVCNAIAYAHSRGILHRDLKPGNIMLGKYGETLVVDWGLAKPLGEPAQIEKTERGEPGEGSLVPSSIASCSQTLVGSALGTPQYMSPEQAAGKLDQLGPASDVYSLGATLYCILTGQPPIGDKDVGSVLQKVQRGDIPKPREVKPDVSIPLEAVCLKAMALNPLDRYQSPRQLADDIEHWLADEPVSAWPEPWTVKTRRWVSRHMALVSGVAASVLVALIGLIVATVFLNAAKNREIAAKEKAEENYQLARGAVKRYLSEVEDNDVLKEPGMEPLKKKLLEAAREYNKKFVELRKGDPTVKVEFAQATFQLGRITAELDSELAAIKLQEEAARMLEALPPDQAGDIRGDLAACYHQLGQLNRLTDRIADSEKWYKEALRLWGDLLKDRPKDARFKDGQARSELGLGNVYQYTSKLDPARKSYEQAIEIWDALHKADPKTLSYRRDLGIAHNNLGMVLMRRAGNETEAKKTLRAAEVVQKQLVAEAPKVMQYQSDLAKTEFNLGEYQDAATRLQAVVERHRAVTEPHRTLAQALTAMVRVYFKAKDPKKAEEAAEKAVSMERKLAEQRPGAPSYRGDLARGLSVLGDVYYAAGSFDKAALNYDKAVGMQEKLARDIPEVPHYQRDLAVSYYGRARVHVKKEEKPKAVEAYKNSIAALEKLIKEHGSEIDYSNSLFRACADLAELLDAGPNRKDALVWYRRALEVAPEQVKDILKKRISNLEK